MSGKPAETSIKNRKKTKPWAKIGTIATVAGVIIAILVFIFGDNILERLLGNEFSYIIRVTSMSTIKPISNIPVEIELNGSPPLRRFTDSSGIATFSIKDKFESRIAKLVINADKYRSYSQEITVSKSSPIHLVQLELEAVPISQSNPTVAGMGQPILAASPTQTLTNTPTDTPSPTYTRTPTATLTPTFTPSPTPAVTLPFSDNFDQGLNSAWFQPIPLGKWFTSDGRLTLSGLFGRQDSYIFVGDPLWSNYKIDLDFWFGRFSSSISVIVRSNPPDQIGLRFWVNSYDVIWEIWQNGAWQRLATQRRPSYTGEGHITIEVKGKKLRGILDGMTQLEIEYPDTPMNGIIGLTSDCNNTSDCSEFDNFDVSEILP